MSGTDEICTYPVELTFRAYHPGSNHDRVLAFVEGALETFKQCEEIQIEIKSSPAEPPYVDHSKEVKTMDIPDQAVIKGFAG